MNDEQLDELVATAAISQDRLDRLDVADEVADLKETIMASPTQLDDSAERQVTGRRGWRSIPAVAAASVIALATLLIVQPFGSSGTGAWAAILVEAAEDSPLLLVTEPGWTVERADIYGGVEDVGEMTFTSGGAELDVHWRDGNQFQRFVDDRVNSAQRVDQLAVLGHDATMIEYEGGGNFTTLFHDGRHTIEVRGAFADETTYRELLGSLAKVDIDTWLSAMPESVIASADRPAAVRRMLADIPLPEGFDSAALEEGPLRERYHLGAQVTGAVMCAWIDQWIAARDAGDQEAVDETVAAIASSHDWAILGEIEDGGAWSQVIWEYAEAIAEGRRSRLPSDPVTIEEEYVEALGCDLDG